MSEGAVVHGSQIQSGLSVGAMGLAFLVLLIELRKRALVTILCFAVCGIWMMLSSGRRHVTFNY